MIRVAVRDDDVFDIGQCCTCTFGGPCNVGSNVEEDDAGDKDGRMGAQLAAVAGMFTVLAPTERIWPPVG
jgi:hypothetical protein